MVKIKKISKESYVGFIYDISIENVNSPYFYANGVLTHNSLYPHIMMMANLNARNKDLVGWHGGKMFEVEGYYDDTKMSGLGLLLRKWYYLRLMYKRKGILEDGTVFKYKDIDKYKGKKSYYIPADDGVYDLKLSIIDDDTIKFMKNLVKNGVDRREYTIKILLNLQYGILNQQYYQLVYDSVAGGDCTRLGRQCIRYARKVFREAGYILINSDTDSWYFVDVFNDKKKYLALKNKVIADIKASMPFPQITFDADIDAIIKHIFFFKGKGVEDKDSDKEMDEDDFINKPKGFMKKNYIYVEMDDKLVIKNLGIKKKSISALSKKIFWDYMVPKIKKDGIVKFSKTEIENLMIKLLQEDISLAYMRKSVNDLCFYKKSMTGIQAQISKKYGPGIHFLIPNVRNIGVGKGIRYCSVEEFEKYKMSISDIDFTNFWKELNYFVKKQQYCSMFDFE